MDISEFDVWYEANRNYYAVKHNNNEEAMAADARSSYERIKRFAVNPIKEPKKGARKKKRPNPYGFDE